MRLLARLCIAALGIALVALSVPNNARCADQTAQSIPITFVAHRPSGSVFASAQTPDGYMWFGTLSGLFRFDGVRYERFVPENTPVFTHPRIYHLAVTTDGRLWVASGNPGANAGSWERGGPGLWVLQAGLFSKVQGLPSDWVMALAAGVDNQLWVGTQEGLALVQGANVTKLGWPVNTDHHVFHVRPDAKGRVWVGAQSGLSSFKNGAFTLVMPKTFPIFSSQAPDASLWMTNLHEIFHLPTGGNEWIRWANGATTGVSQTRAVVQDLSGTVWAGGSGIASIDPLSKKGVSPQALDVTANPDRFMIHSLFTDREGGVWAGSREGGVFHGTPARVANYGSREGMPGDVGFATFAANGGSVYLSFGSGVMRVRNDVFETLPSAEGPKNAVVSMAEAPDHSVWMADESNFISRFDGQRFKRFAVLHKGADAKVRTVVIDHEGQLWIGWNDEGVSRFKLPPQGEEQDELVEQEAFGPENGLCSGRHLVGTARAAGGAWFGSYNNGISQVINGKASCIAGNGVPVGTIMGLHEDPDGALFFGVNGVTGLFSRINDRINHYTHGLETSPYGITSDQHGHLWFGSAAGAYRVKRSDLDDAMTSTNANAPIPWLAFTHDDGLRADESFGGTSPAAAIGSDGRFWFPTLRGISAIADPGSLGAMPVSPPLVETIRANDQEFAKYNPIEVPPGPGNLSVTYTSPAMNLPNQLSFEYQLAGFDKTWVKAHGRRTAYYTNLPPGTYKFQLRVRRGAGSFVHSASPLRISFAPYFYQRWTFYLFVVLLSVAAGFAILRFRLAQLEARHSLIHVERARLARELHDHLGQGFTAIGFALDALRSRLKGSDHVRVADQARNILEHCQTETRRLVWDLRSEAERHPDLESALREVVQRSRIEGGPAIEVQSHGQARVSGLAQHELPLIAQEAITNALRHAHAKTITVVVSASATHTTVTVTDDGQGFPPRPGGGVPTKPGHFGLVGMEERARRMEAALFVHSGPGEGTEISITVPNAIQTES